jgi:hypothetical protein
VRPIAPNGPAAGNPPLARDRQIPPQVAPGRQDPALILDAHYSP